MKNPGLDLRRGPERSSDRGNYLGLKRFLLCPAIPNCPCCAPNPTPTQIIHVTLEGDLTAIYTTSMVHVGGKFRIDTSSSDGVPYFLDADFLSQ